MENNNIEEQNCRAPGPLLPRCCAIRFRPGDQPCTATTRTGALHHDEVVMVQTDHGLEPALLHHDFQPRGAGIVPEPLAAEPREADHGDASGESAERRVQDPGQSCGNSNGRGNGGNGNHDNNRARTTAIPAVIRRASREEQDKFATLQAREQEAFAIGERLIARLRLPMKLLRVERFYNGGKIIFYFTAESRVDFRELVKDLVQEFRTRVEIRQVGVRHETKMIGGIGCCGRELCCSSYIRNFSPVSIKMAKEQGLPLNPAKISGICNRLLCCLTYEFENYQQLRRRLPRPGKSVTLDGEIFKVLKVQVLEERVEVCSQDDPARVIVWQSSEWSRCQPITGAGKPDSDRPSGKPPEKGKANRREKQQA